MPSPINLMSSTTYLCLYNLPYVFYNLPDVLDSLPMSYINDVIELPNV